MKMRTDLWHLTESSGRILGDNPWFQRSQTNSFQPFRFVDAFHQINQLTASGILLFPAILKRLAHPILPCLLLKINSIRTDVDAGEHHFFAAGFYQPFYLCYNVFIPAAAHPSSGIGYHAVGAKLITSILNLDKSPCVFSCVPQLSFLISTVTVHANHNVTLFSFFLIYPLTGIFLTLLQILFQNRDDFLLTVVAHGKIHAVILFNRIPSCLHITPHRNHHRLGVSLFHPVEHLSALSIRNVSHRTCIDDINIGHLFKWDNMIPFFPQTLPHNLRFISIYLAAKSM